jgi:hypothetical protein
MPLAKHLGVSARLNVRCRRDLETVENYLLPYPSHVETSAEEFSREMGNSETIAKSFYIERLNRERGKSGSIVDLDYLA